MDEKYHTDENLAEIILLIIPNNNFINVRYLGN